MFERTRPSPSGLLSHTYLSHTHKHTCFLLGNEWQCLCSESHSQERLQTRAFHLSAHCCTFSVMTGGGWIPLMASSILKPHLQTLSPPRMEWCPQSTALLLAEDSVMSIGSNSFSTPEDTFTHLKELSINKTLETCLYYFCIAKFKSFTEK